MDAHNDHSLEAPAGTGQAGSLRERSRFLNTLGFGRNDSEARPESPAALKFDWSMDAMMAATMAGNEEQEGAADAEAVSALEESDEAPAEVSATAGTVGEEPDESGETPTGEISAARSEQQQDPGGAVSAFHPLGEQDEGQIDPVTNSPQGGGDAEEVSADDGDDEACDADGMVLRAESGPDFLAATRVDEGKPPAPEGSQVDEATVPLPPGGGDSGSLLPWLPSATRRSEAEESESQQVEPSAVESGTPPEPETAAREEETLPEPELAPAGEICDDASDDSSMNETTSEIVDLACPRCSKGLSLRREHFGVSGRCVWCEAPIVAAASGTDGAVRVFLLESGPSTEPATGPTGAPRGESAREQAGAVTESAVNEEEEGVEPEVIGVAREDGAGTETGPSPESVISLETPTSPARESAWPSAGASEASKEESPMDSTASLWAERIDAVEQSLSGGGAPAETPAGGTEAAAPSSSESAWMMPELEKDGQSSSAEAEETGEAVAPPAGEWKNLDSGDPFGMAEGQDDPATEGAPVSAGAGLPLDSAESPAAAVGAQAGSSAPGETSTAVSPEAGEAVPETPSFSASLSAAMSASKKESASKEERPASKEERPGSSAAAPGGDVSSRGAEGSGLPGSFESLSQFLSDPAASAEKPADSPGLFGAATSSLLPGDETTDTDRETAGGLDIEELFGKPQALPPVEPSDESGAGDEVESGESEAEAPKAEAEARADSEREAGSVGVAEPGEKPEAKSAGNPEPDPRPKRGAGKILLWLLIIGGLLAGAGAAAYFRNEISAAAQPWIEKALLLIPGNAAAAGELESAPSPAPEETPLEESAPGATAPKVTPRPVAPPRPAPPAANNVSPTIPPSVISDPGNAISGPEIVSEPRSLFGGGPLRIHDTAEEADPVE